MQKRFLEVGIEKSGQDITVVASDETLDRAGDVIKIESWDLGNFLKNPVLLVNHDYRVESIVGMAKDLVLDHASRKLTFTPEFHELTELSKQVKSLVEEGVLKTVSVGFIPHGPQKDGDIERNELLEISWVAVPANPSAAVLNSIAAKGLEDSEKKAVEDWVSNKSNKVDNQVDNKNETVDKSAFDELQTKFNQLQTELKEGRVLSRKTVSLLQDASSKLKDASSAIDLLLEQAEAEKAVGKVGATKEGDEARPAGKLPSPVRRALQRINRDTNLLLQDK